MVNDNFLALMGYARHEVVGRKHSMSVEPDVERSPEYASFWAALRRGAFQADAYERVGKGGREVRIQETYDPISGTGGRPFKVLKYATDILWSGL